MTDSDLDPSRSPPSAFGALSGNSMGGSAGSVRSSGRFVWRGGLLTQVLLINRERAPQVEIPYLESIPRAGGTKDGEDDAGDAGDAGGSKAAEDEALQELTRLPTDIELAGKGKKAKSGDVADDKHMEVLRANFKHLFR
jgi:hypothetical protein